MDKAKGLLHHHKKDESEQQGAAQPPEQKKESEFHKVEDYVKKSQAEDAKEQQEGKEYGGLM